MHAIQDTSQEQLAADAQSQPVTDDLGAADRQRPQPFRRFLSIGGRAGVDAEYVERIEAELVLLREENARLRFEDAQRPDAGSMIERLKSLSAAQPPDHNQRDDAWHLVSEVLVMRDVLVDVCKEIGQTTVTLQTRLGDLASDLPEGVGAVQPIGDVQPIGAARRGGGLRRIGDSPQDAWRPPATHERYAYLTATATPASKQLRQ